MTHMRLANVPAIDHDLDKGCIVVLDVNRSLGSRLTPSLPRRGSSG